jgi:hypothetical protein
MSRFIGALVGLCPGQLGLRTIHRGVQPPDLAIWWHLSPRSRTTAATVSVSRLLRDHGGTNGHGHRAYAGPGVLGMAGMAMSVFPVHRSR